MPRLITLTTDFGLSDSYVAEMKAVLLNLSSGIILLDVTHELPKHDIVAAGFALWRMLRVCAAGTIHLVVVDPGVGTSRRILLVEIDKQWVICPDNGLFTWAYRSLRGKPSHVSIRELTWRPKKFTNVFHGRDIMAPAAAKLARGAKVADITRPIDDPVMLDLHPANGGRGQIIQIDSFGNCVTNIFAGDFHTMKVGRRSLPIMKTYGDVTRGEAIALVGSAGLVEVAVREGSAARKLKIKIGTKVIAS